MPSGPDTTISRRRLIGASGTAAVGRAAATTAAGTVSAVLGSEAAGSPTTVSAADYIVRRLQDCGVKHLFGVPGATCDPLFAAAAPGGLDVVVTASDLEAGYAADGYARSTGLAAVTVTYGVGTLGMLSVIGGAYAESSPVVVVSGGPSAEDLRLQREFGALFSHSSGREETDLNLFREVTALAGRAERAADVPALVDAALAAALLEKQPVYIEIPKHLWNAPVPAPTQWVRPGEAVSGQEPALAAEIIARLAAAKHPLILLGIEIQRRGLSAEIETFVRRLGLPYSTTMLGKSVIDEATPGFIGVYSGEWATPPVKASVEASDCILAVGCIWGRSYRRLATQGTDRLLQVGRGNVKIGKGKSVPASLASVVQQLAAAPWVPPAHTHPAALIDRSFAARRSALNAPPPRSETGLGYDEIMGEISAFLDDEFVVLSDTTLAMYPAADLQVRGAGSFVCNGVWQAIGFSVAAAVGVGVAATVGVDAAASGGDTTAVGNGSPRARPRRPLVICGDGGFQMTAGALSTMARRGIRAIVVVLDNATYGIEQWLLDPSYFQSETRAPRPYLALHRWDYAVLARAMGVQSTAAVADVGEFRAALAQARDTTGPALISVRTEAHDLPAELRKTR